ncbi:EpsG family protein [Campylobacter sp. VBCF_05 NA6]|uniref:EpsG family protein n=1 Tax=unclassified Campylobacter TaxID=2593542 RepID=UPI0022E9CF99|nr:MULTISPECIES: EpsG family protein [unclassified Campylobacter]MDA3057748.1 EpsG family protein [Campylobacter sp. VBCF_04 NA7]MDA3058878.1 EpsG family protein [Campylobacter sp. VBCF_05 NA6]
MIYWVSFYIIMSCIVLFFRKYKFIPWIMIGFMLTFRYKIGTDYLNYSEIYDEIASGYRTDYDFFHMFLVNFTEYYDFNQQFIFAIYAILTMIFLYKFCNYYFSNKIEFTYLTLTIFLLLFIKLADQMRAFLAISIFLYSTKFIINKNIFKYLICCILTFLIHKSAIIILPMYFILNIKYNKILFSAIIVAICVIPFIPTNIVVSAIEKILSIGNFTKYLNYINSNNFAEFTSIVSKIIFVIYFFIFLLFHKIYNKNDKKEILFFNGLLVYLLIKSVQFHMNMLGRVSTYFILFNYIFLVLLYIHFYKKILQKKVVAFFMVFALNLIAINNTYKYYQEYSAAQQFSFNFSIISKNNMIFQIFGNHEDVVSWRDEQ